MTTIRGICTQEVATVEPTATVIEAARRMRDLHVGDLVVMGPNGHHPIGMITDRDIAVGVVAGDVEHIGQLLVEDVIDLGDVVTAHPEDTPSEVIQAMRERGVRRLPVVEGEVLVGIVSIDDLYLEVAHQLRDLAEIPFAQRTREFTIRG